MKMKMTSIASALLAVSFSATPVTASDYFLYSPQPAVTGKIPAGETGVLVKEITVKWGDTLYGLSRQHAGKGTYYPQILLFNNIKDPDLIYAGKKLRVPVKHAEESVAAEHAPVQVKKPVRKEREEERFVPPPMPQTPSRQEKGQRELPAPVVSPTPRAPEVAPKTQTQPPVQTDQKKGSGQDEQKLYRQGILLFKQGDFKGALTEFDDFLAKYPDSDLAADVTLYRAESLLKLASQ